MCAEASDVATVTGSRSRAATSRVDDATGDWAPWPLRCAPSAGRSRSSPPQPLLTTRRTAKRATRTVRPSSASLFAAVTRSRDPRERDDSTEMEGAGLEPAQDFNREALREASAAAEDNAPASRKRDWSHPQAFRARGLSRPLTCSSIDRTRVDGPHGAVRRSRSHIGRSS